MLAESIYISAKNDTDQTVDVSAVMRPWKFGTDGALSYRGAQTAQTCSPTTGATAKSAVHDNTSNLDLGAHYDITITPQASATGTITVYMETNGADQQTVALVSTTYSAASDARIFGVEI